MTVKGYDVHLLAKKILKKNHGIRLTDKYRSYYNIAYDVYKDESVESRGVYIKELLEDCVEMNIRASKGLVTEVDPEMLKYDTEVNYIVYYDLAMEFNIC